MSRVSRRAFLTGAAGALGGLAVSPLDRLAHSGRLHAPTRLLLVHRPTGTVPASYACTGAEREFALSPILEPFADLREHMVIVDGLEVRKAHNTPVGKVERIVTVVLPSASSKVTVTWKSTLKLPSSLVPPWS
jgi:hypothetical protein